MAVLFSFARMSLKVSWPTVAEVMGLFPGAQAFSGTGNLKPPGLREAGVGLSRQALSWMLWELGAEPRTHELPCIAPWAGLDRKEAGSIGVADSLAVFPLPLTGFQEVNVWFWSFYSDPVYELYWLLFTGYRNCQEGYYIKKDGSSFKKLCVWKS